MRPKPDANRKRRIECDRAHLDSTTVSGLAVRRNVGLGSPTNSQPGRLRYVAQASGLRVLGASSRQFWWYLQDAPGKIALPFVRVWLHHGMPQRRLVSRWKNSQNH